jgi:phenylacetate-CoA ligase
LDRPWGDEIPRQTRSGIGWPATPGGPVAAILALSYQLEKSQYWTGEKLLAAQLAQLIPLARHAQRTVPFYRERLEFLQGIKADQLTLDLWQRIPILTRNQIQDAGADLISTNLPADHGKPGDVVTSGSVGRPIKVKNTNVTRLFHAALNLRYHQWHEREFSGRVCCIRNLGRTMTKAANSGQSVGWVPAFRSGPMFFFDITRPVAQQLDWLMEKDPDYLLTFPSNLAALLKLAGERGARPEKLRQVATMSEVLDPAIRRACRDAWGASLFNRGSRHGRPAMPGS